jgi:hypothetical protein
MVKEMTNVISFVPSYLNKNLTKYLEHPKPANLFLPDWWKKEGLYINPDQNSITNSEELTFKSCSPFLDSLISGYMIFTHQDISVSIKNSEVYLNWNVGPDPAMVRKDTQGLPIPTGHSDVHFAWNFDFGMLLPKGYSALVTHPLNRYDLPFITLSAIVDEGVPWGGKFTFWIKKDFEGVIPAGTPIAQILPFKRESWKSELREDLMQYAEDKEHERNRHISGFYKKFIRQGKSFK